jgi:hypothetical protein
MGSIFVAHPVYIYIYCPFCQFLGQMVYTRRIHLYRLCCVIISKHKDMRFRETEKCSISIGQNIIINNQSQACRMLTFCLLNSTRKVDYKCSNVFSMSDTSVLTKNIKDTTVGKWSC